MLPQQAHAAFPALGPDAVSGPGPASKPDPAPLSRSNCDPTPDSQFVRALFYVVGDADAALLPRITAPVAKLGYVPSRVHASSEAGDGSVMTVDLRVCNVAQAAAKRIENALRSVVGVHQVIAVYEG